MGFIANKISQSCYFPVNVGNIWEIVKEIIWRMIAKQAGMQMQEGVWGLLQETLSWLWRLDMVMSLGNSSLQLPREPRPVTAWHCSLLLLENTCHCSCLLATSKHLHSNALRECPAISYSCIIPLTTKSIKNSFSSRHIRLSEINWALFSEGSLCWCTCNQILRCLPCTFTSTEIDFLFRLLFLMCIFEGN